jgi:hypothetical protein
MFGILGAPDVDWTNGLRRRPVRPASGEPGRHGVARGTVDVVIGRRMRPDAHIIRSVAIVTG